MRLFTRWSRKPTGSSSELEARVEALEAQLRELQGSVNMHYHTAYTKAHPREGDPEAVKRYLGADSW